MCITEPAQILELCDGFAKIKGGREVKTSLIPDLHENDWVLIHANLALKKITEKEAKEIINLYAQYEK